MNRRNFLKNIGKGAAGAVVIATVGSEVVEALSATPVYEDGEYAYYWYHHEEYETRRRFEERMEMQIIEGSRYDHAFTFDESGQYKPKNLLEQEFLSSHPQIMKEKYEVTRSDMSEVKWIKVKKG